MVFLDGAEKQVKSPLVRNSSVLDTISTVIFYTNIVHYSIFVVAFIFHVVNVLTTSNQTIVLFDLLIVSTPLLICVPFTFFYYPRDCLTRYQT